MLSAAHNTGIYKITNTVTGKVYVGSAVNLSRRKRQHFNELTQNKHHSSKLQNAFNKYGGDSFVCSPILFCAKADLLFYEQLLIDNLDSCRNGYNMLPKAGSILGFKFSEEIKKKVSAAKKGVKRKPPTEEARRNMSEAQKGHKRLLGFKHSEETKAKLAAKMKGNKYSLGVKQTEERKAQVRVTSRAYMLSLSEEDKAVRREKIAATWAAKMATQEWVETKAERSARSVTGAKTREDGYKASGVVRTHTAETKAKMAASARIREAKKRDAAAATEGVAK